MLRPWPTFIFCPRIYSHQHTIHFHTGRKNDVWSEAHMFDSKVRGRQSVHFNGKRMTAMNTDHITLNSGKLLRRKTKVRSSACKRQAHQSTLSLISSNSSENLQLLLTVTLQASLCATHRIYDPHVYNVVVYIGWMQRPYHLSASILHTIEQRYYRWAPVR